MAKCICGNSEYQESQHEYYDVIMDKEPQLAEGKLSIGECARCGIIRQLDLPFATRKEYIQYYQDYPPVSPDYQIKDYEHDQQLASKRCDQYGIKEGSRVLDVGSGSGAFVDECCQRGMDAYGCEMIQYSYTKSMDKIYYGCFEELNFPTDHFDVTTCHDTLEHVFDPAFFISELFRVTKQTGICYIDLPRFFHQSGKHHWKREHIWYFNEEQLKKSLENMGFVTLSIDHPIESKTVFKITKPKQNRPKIVFPPGIGDVYWEIVKIESFLKRENFGIPDIYIVIRRNKFRKISARAFPFIQMFPFLNATGQVLDMGPKDTFWNEAYQQVGRTLFKDVLGCDYFMSHNGHLAAGISLEESDPDLECNWFPPMFVSLKQENYRKECMEQYGRYIVFYYVFQGTNKFLLRHIPFGHLINITNAIVESTGCTPILAGAEWDLDDKLLNQIKTHIPKHVDLIGKTNIPQLFGLLRGAELVIGIPSGLTIASSLLKQKTIILWSNYFHPNFALNTCPPSTLGKTYFPQYGCKYSTAESFVNLANNLINGTAQRKDLQIPKIEEFIPIRENRSQRKYPVKGGEARLVDIAVICVFRTGGGFSADYVWRLNNMIDRNVILPYQFICLSNEQVDMEECINIRLKHNYPGYWSKIELFRPDLSNAKRMIYFDLDTVIMDNIDSVFLCEQDFICLRPWNKQNRDSGMMASGMMSWANNGSFSFIYEQFKKEMIVQYSRGDQEYISKALLQHKRKYVFFQDNIGGIYSYKRNCRHTKPADARIVCFHGHPRPHAVKDKWIKEHWR